MLRLSWITFVMSITARFITGLEVPVCLGPHGQLVPVKSSWVSKDKCNVCTCTAYGVECQTWRTCTNANQVHLGNPGDPVCLHGLSDIHLVGQQWLTDDGCNRCKCLAGGKMNCTTIACNEKGFDAPKAVGPNAVQDLGDCRYGEGLRLRVYAYMARWLADDGCNICVCSMPGNFASFPSCTNNACVIPVG